MNACQPRVRRRGMFFQVETPELDNVEAESAEGMPGRIARRKSPPIARASSTRQSSAAADVPEGTTMTSRRPLRQKRSRPLRFATATGSRRRSLMSR